MRLSEGNLLTWQIEIKRSGCAALQMRPAVFIALMPLWMGIASIIFLLTIGRRMAARDRKERLAREAARKQAKPAAD